MKMLDIFFTEDLRSLCKNKRIVFMGDSNVRALYKDFLCLLKHSRMIDNYNLKNKMEGSVLGDKLKYHGVKNNARIYREERVINSRDVHASFYFLTRVYDAYVKDVLRDVTANGKPDVLIINSLLWDITRWGATGVTQYKRNMVTLLKKLKLLVPDCLVIWVTAPPISQEVRGGFLVKELQFLKYSLRFHVVEANHYARKVVVEHGFDVLDSHYHLKLQIHRREKDGIHWMPEAVRYVTNLLLTHISLAWNVPLPHRFKSSIMEENFETADEISTKTQVSKKVRTEGASNSERKFTQENQEKEQDSVALDENRNKENYASPISRRKRPPKRPFRGISHAAYEKETQRDQRRNRIRRWGPPLPQSYSSSSPLANSYLSPPGPQYDSGYFPSPVPNDAYMPNQPFQRDIFSSSPKFSRHFNSEYLSTIPTPRSPWTPPLSSRPYFHDHPPLPSEPYYEVRPPLPREPYPFSPGGQFFNKAPLLQDPPYVFPHVEQGQFLRPRMDFTSDDFTAFF